MLEANQFVLSDLNPYNTGQFESSVTVNGRIGVDGGTIVRANCTLRGPLVIGRNCEIGPGTYLGPYTSIGDNVVIRGGEIENSIVLSDTIIECGKWIVDSLVGKGSKIVSNEVGLPKGHRLIVGENTYLSI